MKILKNERLDKHTTVRLGGIATKFVTPESIDELIDIINNESPKYFLGGGSNLLIADHIYDLVVDLKSFNNTINNNGEGLFKVGASVRLQKLINYINENGYGGIEYLYSVPGLVGGAVVMNAGRGKNYHQTISDYIESVDVIRNGCVTTLKKEECLFLHRNSIFKNGSDLIISVQFRFPKMSKEESDKRKKERVLLCKEKQDASKPNFGSVFMECNGKIMNFARRHRIGTGNVYFSSKTNNWIINDNGKFEDAVKTIKKVELYHKLTFQKVEREVIIWE